MATVREWSVAKVQVAVQCLKNAPYSSTFQAFCDQGTEVFKIYEIDDDAHIEAIKKAVLK